MSSPRILLWRDGQEAAELQPLLSRHRERMARRSKAVRAIRKELSGTALLRPPRRLTEREAALAFDVMVRLQEGRPVLA